MSVADRSTRWLERRPAQNLRLAQVLWFVRERRKEQERRIAALVSHGVPEEYARREVESDPR